MTAVVIAPRVENLDADTEAVASRGWFKIRPSAAFVSGGQWIRPIWSTQRNLTGTAVTVQLDANATVPYQLHMEISDGAGKLDVTDEYRIVPSSGSAVNWHDLVLVSGASGTSLPVDVIDARLDALEAAVGGVSGGASTVATITDMSAYMRLLNQVVDSDSEMRTEIDAAAGTHTHGVSGLAFTGTPSSTTFARGDGTWSTTPAAGNPAWTDITGKPASFPTTITDITGDSATVGALLASTTHETARRAIGLFTTTTTFPTVADGVVVGDICIIF